MATRSDAPALPGTAEQRDEIEALLISYATAVDTKDWALLEAIFEEQCLAEYGVDNAAAAAAGGSLVFRSAHDLATSFEAFHCNLDASLHRISNIVIHTIEGDVAQATSYFDALLLRQAAPAGPAYHVTGRYQDVLAKSPHGTWRFRQKKAAVLRAQGNENVNDL